MNKLTKELVEKSEKVLAKEIMELRKEIAKLILEQKVNPQKDTNVIAKKKKRLAVMLTVLRLKELEVRRK